MIYDCVIVGGGIAGLQAAIQLGRYQHQVLVIDAHQGRSSLCRAYHNILGWPDGVSGQQLREAGKQHAAKLGVQFQDDEVYTAEKKEDIFQLTGRSGHTYEIMGKQTVVVGSGDAGALMALVLTWWSDNILYINHEKCPINTKLKEKLVQRGIDLMEEPVEQLLIKDTQHFAGVRLQSGKEIIAEKAFLAFGKNEVKSDLAKQLGVERLENEHIPTDERSKMTNIQHVWAAGDLGVHSQFLTVAIGEGAQAAVWIHKSLRKEKKRRTNS